MLNYSEIYANNFKLYFDEDDYAKNFTYLSTLPTTLIKCNLKIKDDLVLAGLPFFFESFNFLSNNKFDYSHLLKFEGKLFKKEDNFQIDFEMPFNIALTGERIALNLLQRASSIATFTKKYVDVANGIKILDTRKTTPGLRFLEKYSVNVGGGNNHRFGQMDAWMVKDNHKTLFGGVKEAIEYFQGLNSFYMPIIVEIHSLDELKTAFQAGAKHFLLDNFSPSEIKKAVDLKKSNMTYEVSGGIDTSNIRGYIQEGVDAISSGSITYNAPHVDLSMKMQKV